MPTRPESWCPPWSARLSAALHGTAAGVAALHPGWWAPALGAVAANHALLSVIGFFPRSTLLGPVVHRVAAGESVALTFDDGPDPAVTPHVLDLLAAGGARASFFCIGARARTYPSLVRRMLREGHRVENHSRTHPHHFAFLAGVPLRREVVDAQAMLADVAGAAPGWFRAPMGIRSPLLDPELAWAGLRLAAWTRRGYDTRCGNAPRVARRLLRGLAPGDVLMLHDGNTARTSGGSPVVLEVLPRLLAALSHSRITAVPLPDATIIAAGVPGSRPAAARASR